METNIIRQTKRNIVYVVAAQIFTVILGIIKSLLLPIIIPTVEAYGYWQIYLFYISYVLIFSLGFHEGIYLRYGGIDYHNLPLEKVSASIKIQSLLLGVCTVGAVVSGSLIEDPNRRFAMIAVAVTILLSGITEIYLKLYQCTNRLQKYSKYMFLDKILFTPVIIFLFMIGHAGFKTLILIDLGIRGIVTILLVIDNRKITFGRSSTGNIAFKEWKENITSGSKLLLSNYMAILVTGLGRFLVEQFGDITDYAYYSFGITVTNLVILLISAVSLVLYPVLKKLDVSKYKEYYEHVTGFTISCEAFFMFSYFAINILINWILMKYKLSLQYIPLLLITVYLSGMESLCCSPFLKALRKEKMILQNNIMALISFGIIAVPGYLITRNIMVIPISTAFAMLVKYILAKICVEKLLGIKKKQDFIMIFGILASFFYIQMNIGLIYGMMLYAGVCIFSLFIYRKHFIYFFKTFGTKR